MDWTEYPPWALAALLVVTALGLVVGMTATGAAYGPYNADWNGGTGLRAELSEAGAQPRLALDTDAYVGTEGLAVVLDPTRHYGQRDAARVRQFVSGGGTLVVAGDRGARPDGPTNALLADLGVETRVNGTPVLDDRSNYRNASLPSATNVSEHPLVADVEGLTLNRGTVLDVPNRTSESDGGVEGPTDGPRILVRTSSVAYLDENGNASLDDDEDFGAYPVVAVESVGAGRVVVVSDASAFTNAMLDREGNAAFVRALGANVSTAVIDHSHRPPLGPLPYLLLLVRGTPLLQAAMVLAALGAVAVWTRDPDLPAIAGRFRTEQAGPSVAAGPDEAAALVRERHPDWEDERIRRVSQAIRRRQREDEQ